MKPFCLPPFSLLKSPSHSFSCSCPVLCDSEPILSSADSLPAFFSVLVDFSVAIVSSSLSSLAWFRSDLLALHRTAFLIWLCSTQLSSAFHCVSFLFFTLVRSFFLAFYHCLSRGNDLIPAVYFFFYFSISHFLFHFFQGFLFMSGSFPRFSHLRIGFLLRRSRFITYRRLFVFRSHGWICRINPRGPGRRTRRYFIPEH